MKTAAPLPLLLRFALASTVLILLGCAPAMPQDPRRLLTWPDLTRRPHPQRDAMVSYGPDALRQVDVWLPIGRSRHPVVLMVHGGCWTSSVADRTLMDWIAADLRNHGVAVWNIEYRGVDRPGGGYPGTFLDVAHAADALRANAARFRLDLTRVVAVGHSAGGHLALWLAGRPHLPATSPLHTADPLPIAHVVSLGGLPDLAATAQAQDNGCGTEVVAQLVGHGPDPYADTSVPRLLPLGVAQDLIQGANDDIIPARLATGYRDQAAKAGDLVALHVVANTGHVELIAPESAAWTQARRVIIRAASGR